MHSLVRRPLLCERETYGNGRNARVPPRSAISSASGDDVLCRRYTASARAVPRATSVPRRRTHRTHRARGRVVPGAVTRYLGDARNPPPSSVYRFRRPNAPPRTTKTVGARHGKRPRMEPPRTMTTAYAFVCLLALLFALASGECRGTTGGWNPSNRSRSPRATPPQNENGDTNTIIFSRKYRRVRPLSY